MYRLFKLRCSGSRNSYVASLPANLQPMKKLCSFCSFYHPQIPKSTISYQQYRQRGTTANTAVSPVQKLKKVKNKDQRYGELLEVTEKMTSNRKASIRTLNATQLSIIVDQPNITLDKLHKINAELKKVTKTRKRKRISAETNDTKISSEKVKPLTPSHYEKLNIYEEKDEEKFEMQDLEDSGICDNSSLIKNSSLLQKLEQENPDELKMKKSAKLKPKEKLKASQKTPPTKTKKYAHGYDGQIEESVLELNAYLQVCSSCGLVLKAHNTLLYYRAPERRTRLSDIRLYDTVMKAYARKANIQKIQKLLEFIEEDSLKRSLDTYSAVFECCGRLKNIKDHAEFLGRIKEEMEKDGITFYNVVKVSNRSLDQRKIVLKTVQFLVPGYNFDNIESHNDLYNCRLLKDLTPESRVKFSPAENLLQPPQLEECLREQLQNEYGGEVVINSIEKTENNMASVLYCRQIVKELEESWTETALQAFDRNLTVLEHRGRSSASYRMTLYPFLSVLEREAYIKCILAAVRLLACGSETFSPAINALYREMGMRVNQKYEIAEKYRRGVLKQTEKVYTKYFKWYTNPDMAVNSRIAWDKISEETDKQGVSLDTEDFEWPNKIRNEIGKYLYDIILSDLKLNVNCLNPNSDRKYYLPAFYTLFRTKNTQSQQEIKPHPVLAKLYRESQPETLTFATSLMPSVCPPKPWNSVKNGGYLVTKSALVRLPPNSANQMEKVEAAPESQLRPILDSLNQLGSIPWAINTRLLDIITEVFRKGGSEKLNVPQPPSVLPEPPFIETDNPSDRANLAKARTEYRQKKSEMYSLWCDALYRLSLANHYRNRMFWLPQNLDFRGRVYPIPPLLSHLGSDWARSLLIFGLGKPLGPNGLNWLKLHTINLTGLKKRAPVSERIEYANENIDNILDSAENPLTGKMWWASSDAPWQTLASCMELEKALKSPDPEKYVSRFPIHQDGTCNGLQHYAALGRDQTGAESVNLYPFDTPQDVYSSVAAMIEELRQKDAAKGDIVAKVLEGFVRRKVIKQTVMTTVYGVTKFGARLQIARQLQDIEDFPEEYVWSGSMYLARKTFESLRTMFTSAKEIQDWFTECARLISVTCGKNVEWITPLGLPVRQPYMRKTGDRSRPNSVKQKNAFPPNFIHSLDSSHMMLTSLHCEYEGLTFVSVHDCYWTHPCTIDRMNKICREQFVALHSEPILEDLAQYLQDNFGYKKSELVRDSPMKNLTKQKVNHCLSQVPKKGTFNLQEVLKSTYFFS